MSPRLLIVAYFTALSLLAVGCSPTFYRRQADRQAECLVNQKAVPADGIPGSYNIAIDPRSRMFDPFDPDVEPMPPDDPTSAQYMECVDGKRGSAEWRKLPKTSFVDNPRWQQYLPRNEEGDIALDQQAAMEMALLQSTSYQSQLEELYLSALDVSFERFRFDTQFFGGSQIVYRTEGSGRGGDSTLNVSPFSSAAGPSIDNNRLRAETLTATGGEFVVGLANSLVWQFSGSDNYTGSTLLDFSLVQPLLRAGGRVVVLERLTIAERALLANVRQMERYRRGFYAEIITGRDSGGGPSRRGGFFGGAGLEGFSGVGGGGFGRVGGFGGFGGGGGGGFTGGAGAAQAGGFLGLLQDQQELRNQRANVTALKASVSQLQATFEAGRIDRFQVDLARQALFQAQSLLLQQENAYRASLESFQTDIGLPPELAVAIRDPYLDRFNLLDPDLEGLKYDVANVLDTLRDRRQQLLEAGPDDAALRALATEELEATHEAIDDLVAAIAVRLEAVKEDFVKLDVALPQRRESLEQLVTRPEVLQAEIDTSLLSVEHLNEYVANRRSELVRLQQVFEKTLQDLTELPGSDTNEDIEARLRNTTELLGRTSGELLELSLLQASVRLETVAIKPIELQPAQALAIASAHRRDWMNARANLVDTWRLIKFNANELESSLDLVVNGEIGNVGQNPFNIEASNSALQFGLRFDAPLTRLAERNVYRQSLIEYQQARRSYYQYRDQVYLGLRNRLRQMRLDEINLELRRAAVQLAISQVDLTQLRLSEPPQPGETAELGNTTARDLVQSLSDLLNVQNDFLSVWVDYAVQQVSLEFDLGVMEIDSRGIRIDSQVPYSAYLTNLPVYPSDLYPGMGCGPPLETRDAGEVLEEIEPLLDEIEQPLEMLPAPESDE
ncbi:TolC family protein [Aeoliella sp. ICT_H6.2]|uniref:TolC family protein n=1 Tax=Aeoliella straminimaris TaxID=2954799 RepID=A0A9X2FDI5_9BACT|nr:TolC family protein [Aeoliella straminimaris]MCO6043881.1 TolC family protein [Aeoliella straminimaris]